MIRTSVFLYACITLGVAQAAQQDIPHLRRQPTTQLIVDGKPFLMLAGELHNSSSTGAKYMEAAWPRLKALNLNTVLAALPWDAIEPEEGKLDFTMVNRLVQQARQYDMKLVLLWFGSWKNGVSSYCPAWVLKDTVRFPRSQGSSNHNTKDIISPHNEHNMQADARAFAAVMRHIRQADQSSGTVIMMQVENEVGIKPEPRDLSPAADEARKAAVPERLMQYLAAHKQSLVAELRQRWETTGARMAGTWDQVFGEGSATDEVFSAWHYARYMNSVAKAGKAEYPLPMYVNAWLRGPNDKIGVYPSGGPLAHVMDIWRAAAPEIDLFAPDIYLPDFKGVCAEYTQGGNPLFVPEASTDNAAIGRAFWAIGHHNALGFAPFGIDHVRPEHPLADGYAILRQLAPMIAAAAGTNRMAAVYQQDRSAAAPEQPLRVGDYRANVQFAKRLPRDGLNLGYGIIINSEADTFFVAGYGLDVNFSAMTSGPSSTGISNVELGHFDDGRWVCDMNLNGDETGANYRPKLPVSDNPYMEPTRPKILKIRVYRYD